MSISRFKIPESVLVIIHSPQLDVLLIERADRAGYWQSVTGSLDALGEPLAVAARREVREETGLAAGVLRDWQHSIRYEIYPHWRARYAPGITQNTEHWFSLEVPRDAAIVLNPREHVGYRWLPWHQAAHQCFSASNRDAILRLPTQLGAAVAR